jgi:hypothetical protein
MLFNKQDACQSRRFCGKVFVSMIRRRALSRRAEGFQLFDAALFILFEEQNALAIAGHEIRKGLQTGRKGRNYTFL